VLAPDARQLLRSGFDTVGDALRPTLGPTARTVLIEPLIRTDPPELVDDAATIARRIVELPLYRNAGAMLMRHVVWRVLEEVGDGTATAATIAQALVREAARQIAAGANPAILRRGVEAGLLEALAALDRLSSPLDGLAAVRRVAIAAGHDEAVADQIVEIHRQHGQEVVILTQEWLANELGVEVADGSKWNAGFASAEFVDDQERSLAWAESPYLLFTDVFVERAEQIVPIMQRLANAGGRAFVLIAPKIADSALATLLVNNRREALRSVGVLAPGLGEHRLGVLRDLAAQTGGRLVDGGAGEKVENASLTDLGSCDRVWASRDFFSVIGGDGTEEAVGARVRLVRAALEREEVPHERELLRRRLGTLLGRLVLLNVGAATKSEMLERKVRAERAIKAVESARRDGTVPGGGVALVAAAQAVEAGQKGASLDERLGRLALVGAMEEPLRAIVENAGGDPGPAVAAVRAARGEIGYDALGRRLVDVRAAGILDPANVVRVALRSAVSAAMMLVLCEALVIPRYRYLHASKGP
jgi:chaperonin GroEL